MHSLSLKRGTTSRGLLRWKLQMHTTFEYNYNSIEENEETVDKKDIEELETQISIECIKVYNYLLEIETFEADGTVKEVKNG